MKGYKKVCMYQIIKKRTKRRAASYRRRRSSRRRTGRKRTSGYPINMGQYYDYV